MFFLKISLNWLLPLNHVSERLDSLEGIMHQTKTTEKNIKRKNYYTQLYKIHGSVKLFTLAFIKNVQEELSAT